jgi:hypothetical protein
MEVKHYEDSDANQTERDNGREMKTFKNTFEMLQKQNLSN